MGGNTKRASVTVMPRSRRETQDAWADDLSVEAKEMQKVAQSNTDDHLIDVKEEKEEEESSHRSCFGSYCESRTHQDACPPLLYPPSQGGCPLLHPESYELKLFEQLLVVIVFYSCAVTPVELAWNFEGHTDTILTVREHGFHLSNHSFVSIQSCTS